MTRRKAITPMKVTLTEVERLYTSDAGNPRFRLHWRQSNGMRDAANTATDASWNYEVGNKGIRVGDRVTILLNGRGTVECIEAGWK